MNDTTLHIDGHDIAISNRSKLLFPKSKITKGQLIDYYHNIAPIMLQHTKDRPISMQRFPSGIDQEGFFHKDAPEYFPQWIKTIGVERENKSKIVWHVLCNNTATLVYLANQGVITPHLWLSKADKLNYPDRLIFDLDPSAAGTFAKVIHAAKILKKILESLDLIPFIMTTGSRGLHVVTPIKRELLFDEVRDFARDIAERIAQQYPEELTVEIRKNKRKKRVFVDYLRNAWAQTAVAPYAVRALEGAPVATPLLWKELTPSLHPQKFSIKNIFRRLNRIGDPWQDINAHAGSLKAAQKKLKQMYGLR